MILFLLAMMGSVFAEPIAIEVEDGRSERLSYESSAKNLNLSSVTLGVGSTLIIPKIKSIHIQNLIVKEGARIRLLSLADGADGGSTAQDGANARIFLKEVSGHLLIESRGGDGLDGRDGRDGRQGQNGADGRRARTLFFGLFYLGDGEDGAAGSPGEDGENGGDGGNGGRGGTVSVYYESKTSFADIVVDSGGGKGGRGGNAGGGGLGGNGGRGGAGIQDGRQGPLGPRGKSGAPGKSGKSGEPGLANVVQLEEALFNCLVQLDIRQTTDVLSDSDYDQCRQLPSEDSSSSLQLLASNQPASIQREDEGDTIFLNADGQDGENAASVRSLGSRGLNGSAGAPGGKVTLVLRELPHKVMISAHGGHGGNGVAGVMGVKGADGFDGRKASLFRSATRGTDGGDGGPGGDGSSGGDGGHGGEVRIVYIHGENFEPNWRGIFNLDLDGGRGGRGAFGGEGGRAGKGGVGGSTVIKGKKKADGKNGSPGGHGQQGADGVAGDRGQVEFLEVESFASWIVDDFRAFKTERLVE